MELTQLVAPEAVVAPMKAVSKKQLLQDLAQHAAQLDGLDARELFAALLERERLGSTGMGRGVAIPHARIKGANRIRGYLARLTKPVDYEAVDREPVDLVFLLITPEAAGADHLKALARVSRFLKEPQNLTKLRGARDAAAMHALLSEPESRAA